VDFWDLTKLLLRRWYLAVPGLVLTAVAAAWVMVDVKPNYIATSYVQLAPPTSLPTEPGQPSLDQRNPWIALGLYNLADAAMLTVQQKTVVESFKASGLSETFTATLNTSSPLVTFEVTGESERQAVETTDALIARFSASVTDLQVQAYGVTSADLVTAQRIDFGGNVAESNGRVKRAVVGVAGVGILLTLALTVGVDATARRRARRNAGMSDGLGVDELSPTPAPVGSAPSSRTANGTATRKRSSSSAAGPAALGGPVMVEEPTTGQVTGAGDDDLARVDSTVVLPLSYRAPQRQGSADRGADLR
jgi:hypothetical protein